MSAHVRQQAGTARMQVVTAAKRFARGAHATLCRLKNGIINVNASSGVDAKVQTVCGSTDDANIMAQLLQAGLLYKRYQAQKENPDMAQLLDQAKVTPGGDRLTVRMSVNDDQISQLLKNNTFAIKM